MTLKAIQSKLRKFGIQSSCTTSNEYNYTISFPYGNGIFEIRYQIDKTDKVVSFAKVGEYDNASQSRTYRWFDNLSQLLKSETMIDISNDVSLSPLNCNPKSSIIDLTNPLSRNIWDNQIRLNCPDVSGSKK
jgi:hypothetical protein